MEKPGNTAERNYSSRPLEITKEHFLPLEECDQNPIHHDRGYAVGFGRRFGLPIQNRVFYGVGILAIGLTEVMKKERFGSSQLKDIEAKFLAPVQLGDKVKYDFNLQDSQADITCNNQNGEVMRARAIFGLRNIPVLYPLAQFEYGLTCFNAFGVTTKPNGSLPNAGEHYLDKRNLKLGPMNQEIEETMGIGLEALGDMPSLSGFLGEKFPGRDTLWGSHSGQYLVDNSFENLFVDPTIEVEVMEEPCDKPDKKMTKLVLTSKIFGGLMLPTSLRFLGKDIVFVPNPNYRGN